MRKYIVSIKRADTIIPLTIKATSVLEAQDRAYRLCKFDKIVDTEELESYKSRMGRFVKYSSPSVIRPRTTKRFLIG